MAGKIEKATHQDATDFEGPVDTGDAQAKRTADKKGLGDKEFDQSANKDKGTVFPSGKVAESAVKELFAGVEGLSEDFFKKVATLIEGALSEKIVEITEALKAEYDAKIVEESEKLAAELNETYSEKISAYVDYTVSTFMEENKVAIDRGIKQDIAEQVMTAVTTIVEAAGVELSEDKIDLADSLAEEVVSLEKSLNKSLEENIALRADVEKFQLKEAFATIAAGLTESKKDRLAKLAENLSYENVADYSSKVATLRESIGDGAPAAGKSTEQLTEEVTLKETPAPKKTDDRMAHYLRAARGE